MYDSRYFYSKLKYPCELKYCLIDYFIYNLNLLGLFITLDNEKMADHLLIIFKTSSNMCEFLEV